MDAAVRELLARAGGETLRNLRRCPTEDFPLAGAQGYSPTLFTEIAQTYVVPHRPGQIDTKARTL